MQEAVQVLRVEGVPLCFEQIAVRRERTSRAADGTIVHGLHRFPMPSAARAISTTLDALIKADPEYQCESSSDGSHTVYPRDGGVLGWLVPPCAWRQVNFIEMLNKIGLDDHGISIFPRGLERQPDLRLDLSLGALPVRHWLTVVVRQVSARHYWNLAGFESERSLVIGQVGPGR